LSSRPNYRRNYFVNPNFQLRFSLFVSLIALASSFVYPWVIYGIFERFVETLTSPEVKLPKEGFEILGSWRNELINVLIVYQAFFTGLIFFSCILISHRIAGPIHKACLIIKNMLAGKTTGYIKFRKKDNFHELADELQLLEAFFDREKCDH